MVINALEQLALAMTRLLNVQGDDSKIRLLKMIIAAITSMIVAFILGVVFVMSVFTIDGQETSQKHQEILGNLTNYLVKSFGVIAGFGGSIWGVLKFRSRRVTERRRGSTGGSSPRAGILLATGSEDTHLDVMKAAAFKLIKGLGQDIIHTEKGNLSTFKRGDRVFARVQIFDSVVQLKIFGVLDLSQKPSMFVDVEGLEISPRNTWGNLVFTVRKRGDVAGCHTWIESCYKQAGKA